MNPLIPRIEVTNICATVPFRANSRSAQSRLSRLNWIIIIKLTDIIISIISSISIIVIIPVQNQSSNHHSYSSYTFISLQEKGQLLENVFADPKGFGIAADGRYRYEQPGFSSGTAAVS
jgi:hypothetical protein